MGGSKEGPMALTCKRSADLPTSVNSVGALATLLDGRCTGSALYRRLKTVISGQRTQRIPCRGIWRCWSIGEAVHKYQPVHMDQDLQSCFLFTSQQASPGTVVSEDSKCVKSHSHIFCGSDQVYQMMKPTNRTAVLELLASHALCASLFESLSLPS